MQRGSFVAGLAAAGLLPAAPSFAQADPMPSWNDGPVKQAILDFVPRDHDRRRIRLRAGA